MTPLHALTLAALLSGARCETEVRSAMDAWGARLDSLFPGAPDPTGARVALLGTETLGVWVRLTVDAEGRVALERLTARLEERRTFGPRCETIDAGRRERAPDPDGFTDDALAERLSRGDTGVILLWSPHMPLSVDAYAVLDALTREMGIALVAILHPAADSAYARSVALERAMPASSLLPLSGIELAFRGITTHAPSIQAFAGGRLQGPVVPSHRDPAGFRLAIERALGRRR